MRKLVLVVLAGAAVVLGGIALCQDASPSPVPVPVPDAPDTAPISSGAPASIESVTRVMRPQAEVAVLADARFMPWWRSVISNGGWDGELKANPGRWRIGGVFCTERVLVAAIPRQAPSAAGNATVEAVQLEFIKRPMTRWSSLPPADDLDAGVLELWYWQGERVPQRFTFSFRFSNTDPGAELTGWG
jgi:hypothetical protein